jgi:hypothetical protein
MPELGEIYSCQVFNLTPVNQVSQAKCRLGYGVSRCHVVWMHRR